VTKQSGISAAALAAILFVGVCQTSNAATAKDTEWATKKCQQLGTAAADMQSCIAAQLAWLERNRFEQRTGRP